MIRLYALNIIMFYLMLTNGLIFLAIFIEGNLIKLDWIYK